jgi:hypothetical protein
MQLLLAMNFAKKKPGESLTERDEFPTDIRRLTGFRQVTDHRDALIYRRARNA